MKAHFEYRLVYLVVLFISMQAPVQIYKLKSYNRTNVLITWNINAIFKNYSYYPFKHED
jgi:hypothetical protein